MPISLNDGTSGVFPGAEVLSGANTNTVPGLLIPFTAINSIAGTEPVTSGEEWCFGLVDTIAGKFIANGTLYSVATESTSANGPNQIRKDYTFRFFAGHPYDDGSANVQEVAP